MKKVSLSLAVLSTLVVNTSASAFFTDVPWTDSGYPSIAYLAAKGIIKGCDEEKQLFCKDDPITRAAALKIILSAAEVKTPETTRPIYSDVPEDAWFAPYVTMGVDEKVLNVPEGENPEFHPADEVNRAAFIKMMLATFGVNPEKFDLTKIEISDVTDEDWFAPYIRFVVRFNIMSLNEAKESLPGQSITRVEAVDMLYKTLKHGGGLTAKTLLTLTETSLVSTIENIDAQKIPAAGLAIGIAETFVNDAVKVLPENNVVLAAQKIVLAMKSLVGAYAAGQEGRLDDILVATGSAYGLATEAGELNPGSEAMVTSIKELAHGLADKTRAMKDDVEAYKSSGAAPVPAEVATEEVAPEAPVVEEPAPTEPVEESAPVEEVAPTAEPEAAPAPTANISGNNAVIKAQLAALTPILGLLGADPMKGVITAQMGALEQILLQPSFNKELVLAQLSALEPIIGQIKDAGMKGVITAQINALKQMVSGM